MAFSSVSLVPPTAHQSRSISSRSKAALIVSASIARLAALKVSLVASKSSSAERELICGIFGVFESLTLF